MFNVLLLAATLASAPAPTAIIVPLSIPLDKAWESVPTGRDSRGWEQLKKSAFLTLKMYGHDAVDPDTLLDNLLGDLRKRGITSDDVKWYRDATVVRWTKAGKRGFACARRFPDNEGPLTLIFTGSWKPSDDKALATDAVRACRETTFATPNDK